MKPNSRLVVKIEELKYEHPEHKEWGKIGILAQCTWGR